MRCRRCAESPDFDRDELAEHAEQAGHPLCVVCRHSLTPFEVATCARCVERVRQHLDDIADAWQRLNTDHASWPVGSRHTIPGGNMLVLAGPGSDAVEHGPEALADPPAVAHALGVWAVAWWEQRSRLDATPDWAAGIRVPALFDLAHGYLVRHLQWAANAHPAFREFADDVWALRRALRGTLGLDQPRVTGANCLRCSTPQDPVHLERRWSDAGLSDVWCCQRCGDTLTPAQYLLALRGALEAS